MLKKTLFFCLAVLPLVSVANGFSLMSGTRFIFPSDKKAVTLDPENKSSDHCLLNTRVLDADGVSESEKILALPPMIELKPSTKGSVVLRRITSELPEDRESLFYLSGLFIPQASDKEAISVGYELRHKMFFRPKSLVAMDAVADVVNRIEFRRIGDEVEIRNPTPYYLTFNTLTFDDVEMPITTFKNMLAPYETVTIQPPAGSCQKVNWTLINDEGLPTKVQTKELKHG